MRVPKGLTRSRVPVGRERGDVATKGWDVKLSNISASCPSVKMVRVNTEGAKELPLFLLYPPVN